MVNTCTCKLIPSTPTMRLDGFDPSCTAREKREVKAFPYPTHNPSLGSPDHTHFCRCGLGSGD